LSSCGIDARRSAVVPRPLLLDDEDDDEDEDEDDDDDANLMPTPERLVDVAIGAGSDSTTSGAA
jgi:hypothetical protein